MALWYQRSQKSPFLTFATKAVSPGEARVGQGVQGGQKGRSLFFLYSAEALSQAIVASGDRPNLPGRL